MPVGIKRLPAVGFSEREASDAINQIDQLSLSWGGLRREEGSQYYKNEMIRDGFYTMVALRDTTDRPAPQPIGDVETDQPAVPGFQTLSNVSTVSSRHQYTLTKQGWVQSAQIWVPDIAPTIVYRFILSTLRPDQDTPIVSIIENPILIPGQWNTLFVSHIGFDIGSVLIITVEALNVASSTTWNHPWLNEGISNVAGPTAGGWNRRNQQDFVRINNIDDDGTDQSTDLGNVIVGSELRFAQTNNTALFYLYVVDEVIDFGTYFEYTVTLLNASGGGPGIGLVTTITADNPTPAATEFSTVPNWWIANQPNFATVIGDLEFGGVPQGSKQDDAFGIRMFFQEADISNDWDAVAFSG